MPQSSSAGGIFVDVPNMGLTLTANRKLESFDTGRQARV
jgi:hypothetical protein